MCLAALVALGVMGAPAQAAKKPAKTAAPASEVRDSLTIFPDTTLTAGEQDTVRHSSGKLQGFDQPKWVMARSLVLPGWGQVHNGRVPKALIIGGTEVYMFGRLVKDKRDLDQINDQIEAARAAGNTEAEAALVQTYNERSDEYVGHQWWFGALLAYSMLDAYIDAHFRNFSIDINDDPSLPPADRRAAGLKISWQEHF